MSRPPSRTSTTRSVSGAPSLGSLAGSTLSRAPPVTPKASVASRFGGLSAKQVDKISSTIASARKATGPSRSVRAPDPIAEASFASVVPPVPDLKGKGKAVPPPGAYLASSRFAAAPLTSRVPPASPHRTPARVRADKQRQQMAQLELSAEASSEDEELTHTMDEPAQPIETRESLADVPLDLQEALIVEDLLCVLMGIEGERIDYDAEYSPDDESDRLRGPAFVVDTTLDPSLRSLIERVLPLATHFVAVDAFVQRQSHLEFGLIHHALCAAIRDILRDYLKLIASLETLFNTDPAFTLQRLWLHVQAMLHTLTLVHALTSELLHTPQGAVAANSSEDEVSTDDDSFAGPGADAMKAVMGELKAAGGAGPAGGLTRASGGPVKGGEVLAVIEERLDRTSGASQPYARMLLGWISTGHLVDPHNEFLIRENTGVTQAIIDADFIDEYWERRYTLRDAAASSTRAEARDRGVGGGAIVPRCLELWKAKILLAGKYLNVVRECGLEIAPTADAAPTPLTSDIAINDDSFYSRIDLAYTSANKTLLQLLVKDQELLARLRSLKHYFFLDQADTFAHFLDSASIELSKKAKQVSLTRLQHMLDLALRQPGTASAADPYKEDVKVGMSNDSITDWLVRILNVSGTLSAEEAAAEAAIAAATAAEDRASTPAPENEPASTKPSATVHSSGAEKDKSSLLGIDGLTLNYVVPFPASLVISRGAILRYQLLFRHLLGLHNAHEALQGTWLEHTKAPCWRIRSSHPPLERWKSRVFALRTRMLAFVRQLQSFVVGEVLEPRWRKLIKRVERVETVDELLHDHMDFLQSCLKECMLTQSRLLRLHSKLLTTCSLFVKYTKNFTKMTNAAIAEARAAGGEWSHVSLAEHDALLRRFEDNFYHNTAVHLDLVTWSATADSPALLPLVLRLSNLRPSMQQDAAYARV